MGFFSDLWNGIKSVGSSIWDKVKSVGSSLYNTAGNIISGVKNVAGGIADFAGKIPIIGAPVAAAANTIRNLAGQAGDIHAGIGGVAKVVGPVGDRVFQK